MSGKFNIVAVIEHYTGDVLSLGGGWVKLKCPVHDENNPSASYKSDKGSVRCFGCGFFGDAIDLIQRKEGLDYGEARERASEITGETLDGTSLFTRQEPVGRCKPVRLFDGNHAPPRRTSAATVVRRKPRRI